MTRYILRYTFTAAAALGLCSASFADHHKKPLDLVGVWNVTATSSEGDGDERKITWTIRKEGEKLTGDSKDHENGNERTLDRIKTEGNEVVIEIDIESDGNRGIIKVIAEEKEAGKLVGKWTIEGEDGTEYLSGELTALKEIKVAYAGDWNSTSVLPNGEERSAILQLSGDNANLKGAFKSDDGNALTIDEIKADGKNVRLEFKLTIQDNVVDAAIEGELKAENKLAGKWILTGDDGSEFASGDWSAVREAKLDIAGVWNVSAVLPEGGEYTGTLTLKRDGEKYVGKSKSSDGEERELNSVKFDGEEVVFTIELDGDVTGTITVTAKRDEGKGLIGTWKLVGSDGSEVAGDEWKAVPGGSGE